MKALMIAALVAAALPIAAGAQSTARLSRPGRSTVPQAPALPAIATAGDRIRISWADGSSVVGTVVEVSDSQVRLLDPGGEFVVARDEIHALEVSRGEGPDFAKNFLMTTGAGALVFGVISAATYEPRPCVPLVYCPPKSAGEAFALGVLSGGIVSIPIGLLVGLFATSERWEPTSLPRPGSIALSFAPVGVNGFSFRGSIPVGGR